MQQESVFHINNAQARPQNFENIAANETDNYALGCDYRKLEMAESHWV